MSVDGGNGSEAGIKHTIEAVSAKIHTPLLKKLGSLEKASARVFDYPQDALEGKLTQLADLETHKKLFEDMSTHIGLDRLHTAEDIKEFFKKEKQAFDKLPRASDAFHRLHRLLRLDSFVRIGNQLRAKANESLGIQAAVEDHPELAEKDFGAMSKDELRILADATSHKYKEKKLPETWDLISEEGGINSETFTDDMVAKIDSQRDKGDATEFAHYKEAMIGYALFHYLAQHSADEIGRDILTGKPVIYHANGLQVDFHRKPIPNYPDVKRFARELPEQLKEWQERQVVRMHVPDHIHNAFFESSDHLGRVVAVVLPDGLRDEAFQQYEAALSLPQGTDQKKSRDQAIDKTLLAVRRKIFARTVDAFSQATSSLHPEVEIAARNLAVYGLSEGEGGKTYFGHHLIEQDKDKPLAESVKTLRQIAYKEGIYLDPLKEEMAKRIREEGRDPRQIAQLIRSAYTAKEEGGNPFDSSVGETLSKDGVGWGTSWYITQSLFAASSLEFPELEYLARQPADYQSGVGIKYTEKGITEPPMPDDGSKLTEIRKQGFRSPPRNGAVVEELATFIESLSS